MKIAIIALSIALMAYVNVASAAKGVDVSSLVSESDFHCMKDDGYSFAVVRAYESINKPDPNAPATVRNAWNGGMRHVDIYVFPCAKCGDPAAQIRSTHEHMKGHSYGMLWLDIEGPQYWHSDHSSNINFIQGMLNEAKALGVHVGVYTSESQWSPITGNWHGASDHPLWYAHYDGRESFSDFASFGGWTKPAVKQFAGTTSKCGAGVDLNWYP